MSKVLLDTSAFIAGVDGEIPLAEIPGEATLSVMTVCELHHGILTAGDAERAVRLRALDVAHHFDALPIDGRIAPRFGELMAGARRRTGARPDIADTLIAATAVAYGLPLVTRDGDFKAFPALEAIWL